ncbi:MAG: DUF2157 domain-containing protein [Phycisphaerae bacterium]|nr:DUF2157 domain-containing protein [Phycisphaerae bacterium]
MNSEGANPIAPRPVPAAGGSAHDAPTIPAPPAGAAAPAPPEPPAPTRSLDPAQAQALVGERYRVERIAGEGGMGSVLLATDSVLSRRVAIKLLHNVSGRDGGDARARLLAEARAMAGLSHPNIVRVLEISLDGQPGRAVPFMVMEWIDGVPLAQAWRGLTLPERVSLLLKIVDGVAEAHAAGLVHGDLKPSNILLDRSGTPVIVDFGLARAGRGMGGPPGAPGPRTISGGTPGYAAPEQFEPGGPVGAWSDVYALGVILFEMLTGRTPFIAGTTAETLRLQRETEPPLPEHLAPEAPVALQRICLVALERDPWRRYKDASELAQDLRRYLRGETVTARPTTLAARFVDQVQEQIDRAGQWQRQGLVTEAEQRALVRTLRTVLRPDSPWLIDSRRLSASQVSLYMGGWLLILGLSVGSYKAWDVLPDWLRLALPIAAAAVLGLGGALLHRRGYQRTGLAYLVTACIAAPVAALLVLKRLGWPYPEGDLGAGAAEFFARVRPDGDPIAGPAGGLFNAQVLIAAAALGLGALAARRLFKSSAFTLLATLGAVATGLSLWLLLGGYVRPHTDRTWADLALWLAALGVAGLAGGLALSRQEEKDAARIGHHNLRRADAWPLLTFGLALLFAGLLLTAWHAPGRLGLPQWLAPPDDDLPRRALGFVAGGAVLALVSGVLAGGSSLVRERLAHALRWVLPSHFLAPLIVLHHERFAGVEWPWIFALAGGAVFLVYASVLRQWKPFLVNGLLYALVAYVLAFNQVLDTAQHFPAARVWMMAGMVVLGLVVMLLAWLGPIALASARGRWWMAAARRRMSILGRTRSWPGGPDRP